MSYMVETSDTFGADDVRPGMAYFTNTGPRGKTCGTCVHRGHVYLKKKINERGRTLEEKSVRNNGCEMFHKLSGKHGPAVKKDWNACKYYEARRS
jgi:hypothetical protein